MTNLILLLFMIAALIFPSQCLGATPLYMHLPAFNSDTNIPTPILKREVDQFLASGDATTIRRSVQKIFELVDRLNAEQNQAEAMKYLVSGLKANSGALGYQILYAEMLQRQGDRAAAKKIARLVRDNAERDEHVKRAYSLLGERLPPSFPDISKLRKTKSDKINIALIAMGDVDQFVLADLGKKLQDRIRMSLRVYKTDALLPPFKRDPYKRSIAEQKSILQTAVTKDPTLERFLKENLITYKDLEDDSTVIRALRLVTFDKYGNKGLATLDDNIRQLSKLGKGWDSDDLLATVRAAAKDVLNENTLFLGVVNVDMFDSEAHLSFGLAENSGRYGVIAYRRFTGDFNHQDPSRKRLVDRTFKQSLSSIGFMLGVPRCTMPGCARAYPHSLQEHDAKSTDLCDECRKGFEKALKRPATLDKAVTEHGRTMKRDPKDPLPYHDRAVIYLHQGKFDQAMKDLDKAIELNPKYVQAYITRGDAHSKKQQLDLAVADYSKAIEFDPRNEKAYTNRAGIHRSRGDFDLAIADASKAVEINPKSSLAYFERGTAYSSKKDFGPAISDLTKAIEIKKDFPEAFNNRGNAFLQTGKRDAALADFSKAIELDPKNEITRMSRGGEFHRRKEFDKALADYGKAVELNPRNYSAHTSRGTIYHDFKEYKKAIQEYDSAIQINPAYTEAYYNRGLSHYYLRDLDAAIADYSKAVGLNPKHHSAYHNRGTAYREKKELDRAIADYSTVVEIQPGKVEPYVNRGETYVLRREYELAMLDYNKALEIDPGYVKAYNSRGTLHGLKGEHSLSISDYSKALEIDPKNSELLNNRGYTYAVMGDYDKAISDLDKSIELNPKFTLAYVNRGNTHARKKMIINACWDWKSACELGACRNYENAKQRKICR
jgi:tetratricopeptide (TPR) repeat protein